jgi:MFS family permease
VDKSLIFLAAVIAWSHDAVGLTITNFLAVPIMDEFGVGKGAIGFIFSAQYIATVFGAILFGELADRFGRKRALIYSVIWDAAFTALTALSPNYITLALLRILSGMGVSWGIGFAILSEVYSPRFRGFFGGLIHATFIIGYIISAATVSILFPLYGWRVCYLIGLYSIPIVLILGLFMPESRVWIKYKELEEAGEITAPSVRIRELFSGRLFKLTILCSLLFWGSEFAYHVVVDWAPTLVIELFGFDVGGASKLLLLISGVVLPFLPFIGLISDFIGRKLSFIASASIGMIGVLLFGYYTIISFNEPMALNLLYIIPLGFGAHALYGVWSSEIFPTKVRATATSLVFSVARGFSLGGLLVGVVSRYIGLVNAMVYFGIFGFFLMVILPIFLPETKGKVISIEEELSL